MDLVNWLRDDQHILMKRCVNYAVGATGVYSDATGGGDPDNSWHPTYGLTGVHAGSDNYDVAYDEPLLTRALTAFAAQGVTHVEVCFGHDDANKSRTAVQFAADLYDVVAAIVANGAKVMVHLHTMAQNTARDVINTGYKNFLSTYVDNATIFEGVNFYDRMQYKGDDTTPGPLFLAGSAAHPNGDGYSWCYHEVRRRYALTGWHLS
jgi:hypothetical protein